MEELFSRLHGRGKAKEQLELWHKLRFTAFDEDEGFLDAHAVEVASLVLEAARKYTDNTLERAVVVFASAAAKRSSAFMKALASGVVKVASGKPAQQLGKREMFTVLMLSKVVLDALDVDTAKKALPKLLEVQISLVDALMAVQIPWKVVSHVLQSEMRNKQVAAMMLSMIKNGEGPLPHYILHAVLDRGLADAAFMVEVRMDLLGAFCDRVVNGRQRIEGALSACYAPLASSLTNEEVSTKIVPAVMRSLRRTPEVAISALTTLLTHAPHMDMSSHAMELGTTLVQQIRTKEGVRPMAVDALRVLARRTNDATVLGELAASIRKILDGSAEGKIKMAVERAVLANSLASLSEAPGFGPAMAAVAADLVVFAAGAIKEEANDEARASLTSLLGCWLVRLTPVGPHVSALDAAAATLAEGCRVSVSEIPRRAHLRAAVQALRGNVSVRAHMAGALTPAAVQVVVDGLSKPALRLDATLAACAAVLMASASSAADTVLDSERVWEKGLLAADSPLLSAVAKLPAADAAVLPDMVEALLLQHPHRLQGASNSLVCCLLCGLLVHWAPEVRASAAAASKRVTTSTPALVTSLLEALRSCMNKPSSVAPSIVSPDASGEDLTPTAGLCARRFASAFLHIMPPKMDEVDADKLSALLLTAHHPAITAAVPVGAARQVWHTAARRIPTLIKAFPGLASSVSQVLTGPQGLSSTTPAEQTAARQALSTCIGISPNALMPHVLEKLTQLLDRSEHDALSPEALEIFATPEGHLASEWKALQEVSEAVMVVERRNVRKAKGRFKSGRSHAFEDDNDDDDEPPPPPPPPKPAARPGAPGGKKDAAARQAEWRANEISQESKVRAHVRAIRTQLQLGLRVLCDIAVGNPRFAATKLEELRELCQPLLSSKVVGSEAFDAVRQLAACLPAPLSGQSLGLAAALRLVVLARQAQQTGAVKLPVAHEIADVVIALRQVTGDRRPLQGASYRFVFPVLQAILSSPTHTPAHEDALAVVALHCGAHDVPRAASLSLLYHLLGVMPAYRDRVQPLLKQLVVGAVDQADILAAARGVTHPIALVRGAALAALPLVPALSAGNCPRDDGGQLVCMLHMACHDPDVNNVAAAHSLWELAKCELPQTYILPMVRLLVDAEAPDTTNAAAAALAAAAKAVPGTVGEALAQSISAYGSAGVSARCGVGAALRALAPELGPEQVLIALDFLIGNGLADMSDKVREVMVLAGMAIVDTHGAQGARTMMPLFESYLDSKRTGLSVEQEAEYDLVREGVVVFLGTLTRHLPPDDPKRSVVVDTLVTVLATPSEGVQRAVSNCLPPLMGPLSANKEAVDGLVVKLLNMLTKGKTFGERRGAAFGLAGVVKGLGLMAMKNCGIMDALKAAVEDKKDPAAREGALMAFECLSQKLGKLFEPYIIYILPLLLNCFGDTMPSVRAATEDAAHMIMGQLTASGVKLVLPALLKGLEDKVWRTKQGSVQLLGSMSHCAPKQLGSCLPTIVPRLSDVLNDPHPKVQAAANEALQEIGSVIRNPEIMDLVPYLLSAIADPNHATKPALEVLLQTVFVNTIDAASLALILPVIHRGLRDRTGDTKKKAARIAGNMASLVNDPKDILPYVPMLMPELQKALVDPLPEVRAMAARAMGSLMQGMGSEQFSDLVPWLMATLASEGSAVERSGAAQGLAEVLTVLGPNHLEAMMPDILEGAVSRASPAMREGHLVLMHYLPITMGAHFQSSLQRVLPAILDGLADESEGVRDAALSAGRILVDQYAHTALLLLLPAIENGLLNDNWRIRQSSVKLLGKLLFKIAGTSGNIQQDGGSDDEGAAEEGYNQSIIQALGLDRRNEVLSRLYICRSDPQYTVRNESLHVWKSVVYNTPKTLAVMMGKLMEQLIESLAVDSEDRCLMAGRCLGELVRKLGDRVLGRIIPILKDGVFSGSTITRRGVCAGIKELLENISRQQLTEHMSEILPAVQNALTDADPGVRETAGEAFSIMFKGGAGGAVDSVVPQLLEGLAAPPKFSECLEGLRVILGLRPQIFNFVLPKLIRQPLMMYNLQALTQLALVASPVLNNHVASVLPPLLTLSGKAPAPCRESASSNGDAAVANGPEKEKSFAEEHTTAATQAAEAVMLAVQADGLQLLVSELLRALEDPGPKRRAAAALLSVYPGRCSHTEELLEHVSILMDRLISLFSDTDAEVVLCSWKAAEALVSIIPKEEQAGYVRCVREALATARENERRKRTGKELLVAGLCLPKALAPLLPIFLQGMLQGSSTEAREAAAEGLGEMVALTSQDALRPFVVQITGPLIRIIGDRFPSQIKAAILVTLGLLITKAGPGLKPFVPQLQTTFLKCLSDPADTVRERAATNLGGLSTMSPRVDQLANDLAQSARTGNPVIRNAYLLALSGLLNASGDRVSQPVMVTVGEALRASARIAADDESFRYGLASCLGAHSRHAPVDLISDNLQAPGVGPLAPTGLAPNASDRHLQGAVLATVAGCAGPRLQEAGVLQGCIESMIKLSRDKEQVVKIAAGRAAARLAVANPSTLEAACGVLATLLGPDQPTEVSRQALLAVRRLADSVRAQHREAGKEGDPLEPYLSTIMPPMCSVATHTSGPVRSTAERSLVRVLDMDPTSGSPGQAVAKYLTAGPGGTVKSLLTEPFLRRAARISFDDELFTAEEY